VGTHPVQAKHFAGFSAVSGGKKENKKN